MSFRKLTKQGVLGADTLRDLNAMLAELYSTTVLILPTTDGTQVVLEASSVARMISLTTHVRQTFADGAGTQTVVTIGNTSDADQYFLAADFTDAADGTIQQKTVLLPANEKMTAEVTAATVDGTGALDIIVTEV